MHRIWTKSGAPVIQTVRGFKYIFELQSEASLGSLGAYKAMSFGSSQSERAEEFQLKWVFITCKRGVHCKFKNGF